MRFRRPVVLLTAAVVALTASACASSSSGPPEIAATVDGVEIPSSRIDEIVEGQSALLADVPSEEEENARAETARNALSAEIQLQAVEAAVEERFGLDIPDEDIDAALEAQIEAQGGQDAFDQLAEEQGLTSEEAMAFAREQAYVQVLVEYVQGELAAEGGVSEEELRAQYEADLEALQTATVSHILVETEAEAQDVVDRLAAGDDFASLAEELSQDPGSAANGGSLGQAPRGSYVEPFEEYVWSDDTELGAISPPIETQFGFHVIRVDERTTPTFEEARPQIEAQLAGAQFSEFLDTVFEEAEIVVDPYYGSWDPEARMVVPPADETEEPADEGGAGDDATQEPAEDGATGSEAEADG